MKKQASIAVGALLALGASWALAQERGLFVSPTTGVAVNSVWGIFIGVSKFEHSDLNLNFAATDARKLHAFFTGQFAGRVNADHFKLITDREATRGKILKELGEVAGRAARNDLLILFVATHGFPDAAGQDLYFYTHDTDPNLPEDRALSRHDLDRVLTKAATQRVVLLLDACHAGGMGQSTALAMRGQSLAAVNLLLSAIGKSAPGRVAITSSSASERSQESKNFCGGHGAFTCALLTGLEGAADGNHDGLVGVRELYDFAYGRVKDLTNGAQHPTISDAPFDEGLPLAVVERASVPQAGKKVNVDLGGSSSNSVAYVPPDTSDYDRLLKDAERQETERKKAEEARRKYLAALDTAWDKVKAIADKTAVAKDKRIAVVRKFLSEFPQDNPRQTEAEGLIREIEQERAPEQAGRTMKDKKPKFGSPKMANNANNPTPAATEELATSGGDGWRDSQSGLTWQVTPSENGMKWADAKSYCSNLSLGGYSDWRLPSIDELRSLVRGCAATQAGGNCKIGDSHLKSSGWSDACRGCSWKRGPGVDGMYWPRELKGQCCSYWSSSPVADGGDNAWHVRFLYGDVGSSAAAHDYYVRCVR